MHQSYNIFLVNENARVIEGAYEEGREEKTLFKTLNTSIEKGDLILVQTATRYHLSVVKVTDVDIEPDLSGPPIRWAYQTIDTSMIEHLKQEEEDLNKMLLSQKRKKAREELRKEMLGTDFDFVKSLPMADMTEPKPVPAPTPEQRNKV